MFRAKVLVLTLFGIPLFLASCQKAPFITVAGPLDCIFDSNGGAQTLVFSCNRDWSVSSSEEWIKITPSSGTASDKENSVAISCLPNTTYDSRNATIAIKGGELIQTITISQESFLKAIDLGLSVKWANINLGAKLPEAYGGYYAWGEIGTKETYNQETYKWYERIEGTKMFLFTKYNTWEGWGIIDMKTRLDLEDDAAHVIWGKNWRIPKGEELQELFDNCDWVQSSLNGVDGYKVVSKINNNFIFLPAAGLYEDNAVNRVGTFGLYWTSDFSSDPRFADILQFVTYNPYALSWGSTCRFHGLSIRPVTK